MNRNGRLSVHVVIALAALLLYTGNALPADQQVITDDGREVLLKQDGTWEFRSSDRFANTVDGQRVRLKQDGSWEYVGNAPLVTSSQVRTIELDVELQQVVIERHEQKAQKNKRVSSQTVFYVDVSLSPRARNNISISQDDIALVKVRDNKGNNYPVLSIKSGTSLLEPDMRTTMVVRADGSPKWWKNIKTLLITFHPGMFGTAEPMTLSQRVSDIEKKDVDGFEEIE
jgi:hypothetical protein